MNNKINKEAIKLFFEKLAQFINYIFPGLFVLELFFHRGFFSNKPETLIDGILFLFWCIIFSIPYHFIQPFSVYNLFDNVKKELVNKKIVSEGDIIHEKDELENWKSEIELLFILMKILLTYFIFKFICYFLTISNYMGVNQIVWKFLFTIILMTILSYPMGYIFSLVMKTTIIKFVRTKLD